MHNMSHDKKTVTGEIKYLLGKEKRKTWGSRCQSAQFFVLFVLCRNSTVLILL